MYKRTYHKNKDTSVFQRFEYARYYTEEDKFDRNTKEIQAESVAFWVAEMIGNGLDTSEYSFGYISGWSKDKTVPELKENLDLML